MTVGGLLPGFSTKPLQSTPDLAVARNAGRAALEGRWQLAGANSSTRSAPSWMLSLASPRRHLRLLETGPTQQKE